MQPLYFILQLFSKSWAPFFLTCVYDHLVYLASLVEEDSDWLNDGGEYLYCLTTTLSFYSSCTNWRSGRGGGLDVFLYLLSLLDSGVAPSPGDILPQRTRGLPRQQWTWALFVCNESVCTWSHHCRKCQQDNRRIVEDRWTWWRWILNCFVRTF